MKSVLFQIDEEIDHFHNQNVSCKCYTARMYCILLLCKKVEDDLVSIFISLINELII